MNAASEEVFAKVKDAVHIEGLEIALVTPQYYDAVCELFAKEFIPDEPLGKAINLEWTNDVEASFRISLQNNLSLMAVTESGDVVGVSLIDIVTSDKETYLITDDMSENWRNLLEFFMQKKDEVKFFKRYCVEEAVHFFGLSVGREFRRRGLGSTLIRAGLLLGAELEFQAFMIEASSLYTKKICIKHEFDELAVFPFEGYTVNGVDLFRNREPDEHTSTIIYGKKI